MRGIRVLALVLASQACVQARAEPVAAQTWPIDAAHSQAGFWLRPVWIRRIEGEFPLLEGVVLQMPGSDQLRVDVRIDVRALRMARASQVSWAHSPEFFDVERHPWIRFQSGPVSPRRLREGGPVTGVVTLRGVTRAAHFVLEPAACADPGFACPVRATGQVRRSLFGMNSRRLALGDHVNLEFSIRLAGAAGDGR